MDETPKEREVDEKFATLMANLAKEKGEFRQSAEELEARANAMKVVAFKRERELETDITPRELILASQSAWAFAQVFRLGERMTTELEWLYQVHYTSLKNMVQLSKELPDRIHADTENLMANYERGLDEHMADMVKSATKHVITELFQPRDSFEEKRDERNDPRESS